MRSAARSGQARVYDSAVLADALRRVCEGECIIDPGIVSRLLARSRERGPLEELTQREVEILSMMAEGHSNNSICGRLVISPRTVESHVRSVFMKLGIAESPDSSRLVLAVLAFLQARAETGRQPRRREDPAQRGRAGGELIRWLPEPRGSFGAAATSERSGAG